MKFFLRWAPLLRCHFKRLASERLLIKLCLISHLRVYGRICKHPGSMEMKQKRIWGASSCETTTNRFEKSSEWLQKSTRSLLCLLDPWDNGWGRGCGTSVWKSSTRVDLPWCRTLSLLKFYGILASSPFHSRFYSEVLEENVCVCFWE